MAHLHKSAQAKAHLTDKQENLGVKAHSLIMDVKTRWNSTLGMIERYVEQHPAIYGLVMDEKIGSVSTGRISVNCEMISIRVTKQIIIM